MNPRNGMTLGKKLGIPVKTDDEIFYSELGDFLIVKIKIDTKLPLPYGVEILNKAGS